MAEFAEKPTTKTATATVTAISAPAPIAKSIRVMNTKNHVLTQGRGWPRFEPNVLVTLKPEEITGWTRAQLKEGCLKEV